jgi:hypothetical protein
VTGVITDSDADPVLLRDLRTIGIDIRVAEPA